MYEHLILFYKGFSKFYSTKRWTFYGIFNTLSFWPL